MSRMMIDTVRSDLKYSLRLIQKKPGFAAVVIVILALGIGINSSVFSLVNAILLKPLPAKDPAQLVRMYKTSTQGSNSQQISYPDYLDYKGLNQIFSGIAAVNLTTFALRVPSQNVQRQLLGETVSSDFFSVLGVNPARGRSFKTSEGQVAIISSDLWKTQFAGSEMVIGQSIVLNGAPFDIIGVAPKEFRGTFVGARVEVWIPLESAGTMLGMGWKENRDRSVFQTIARLRPGVSQQQAQSEVDRLSKELERIYPKTNTNEGLKLVPATYLHGGLRKAASAFLAVVMVLVGFVLLIACFNVANLLLARGLGRGREMAIRCSLGANRFRLIQQMITESTLLASIGGIAGILLAYWVSELLTGWNPIPFVPFELNLVPDLRVIGFALAASLMTGILIGIIPAFRATNQDVSPLMKESGTAVAGGKWHSRFRDVLVVAQLAVCLLLLIQVALFSFSLKNSLNADPGFDSSRMFATDIDLDSQGLDEQKGRQFYSQLMERLSALPDVESATLADRTAPDISTPFEKINLEGTAAANSDSPISVSASRVYSNYFETLKIPVVQGRLFDARDHQNSLPVVIINQTMAAKFWPQENPLGNRFRIEGATKKTVEIIGVARDSKYRSLGEDPTPHLYLPFEQNYVAGLALQVRTRSEPGPMIPEVQRVIQSVHPQIQGFFTRTLEQHIGFSLLPAKVAAVLTGVFGTVALWIALIGIYGAISYLVSSRSREIGIRMAMGAESRNIFRMVLRKGLFFTIGGLSLGAVVTLAVNRLISGLLFGVSPYDPVTWLSVIGLLSIAALSACAVPARRAAKLNPVTALRYE